MTLDELLLQIKEAPAGNGDAATHLELLLEYSGHKAVSPQQERTYRELLPPSLHGLKLSPEEKNRAVLFLLETVKSSAVPSPEIAWALVKSREEVGYGVLKDILLTHFEAGENEEAASAALYAFCDSPETNDHTAFIVKAAEKGHGKVKQQAEKYMREFPELFAS